MISRAVKERLETLLAEEGRGAEVWPDIPRDLLTFLERLYPPRCMDPREGVEDHLRYAGAVSLIADMRHHHNLAQEIEASLDAPAKDEVEIER